jgi:hypothetical protein
MRHCNDWRIYDFQKSVYACVYTTSVGLGRLVVKSRRCMPCRSAHVGGSYSGGRCRGGAARFWIASAMRSRAARVGAPHRRHSQKSFSAPKQDRRRCQGGTPQGRSLKGPWAHPGARPGPCPVSPSFRNEGRPHLSHLELVRNHGSTRVTYPCRNGSALAREGRNGPLSPDRVNPRRVSPPALREWRALDAFGCTYAPLPAGILPPISAPRRPGAVVRRQLEVSTRTSCRRH